MYYATALCNSKWLILSCEFHIKKKKKTPRRKFCLLGLFLMSNEDANLEPQQPPCDPEGRGLETNISMLRFVRAGRWEKLALIMQGL